MEQSIDMDGKDEDDEKIVSNMDLSTSGNDLMEDDLDSNSSGSSKSINYDIQRIRNISSQLSMNRHMMNKHMTSSEVQT